MHKNFQFFLKKKFFLHKIEPLPFALGLLENKFLRFTLEIVFYQFQLKFVKFDFKKLILSRA